MPMHFDMKTTHFGGTEGNPASANTPTSRLLFLVLPGLADDQRRAPERVAEFGGLGGTGAELRDAHKTTRRGMNFVVGTHNAFSRSPVGPSPRQVALVRWGGIAGSGSTMKRLVDCFLLPVLVGLVWGCGADLAALGEQGAQAKSAHAHVRKPVRYEVNVNVVGDLESRRSLGLHLVFGATGVSLKDPLWQRGIWTCTKGSSNLLGGRLQTSDTCTMFDRQFIRVDSMEPSPFSFLQSPWQYEHGLLHTAKAKHANTSTGIALPLWRWAQKGRPPVQALLVPPGPEVNVFRPDQTTDTKAVQLGRIELCDRPGSCQWVYVYLPYSGVSAWLQRQPIVDANPSGFSRDDETSTFQMDQELGTWVLEVMARRISGMPDLHAAGPAQDLLDYLAPLNPLPLVRDPADVDEDPLFTTTWNQISSNIFTKKWLEVRTTSRAILRSLTNDGKRGVDTLLPQLICNRLAFELMRSFVDARRVLSHWGTSGAAPEDLEEVESRFGERATDALIASSLDAPSNWYELKLQLLVDAAYRLPMGAHQICIKRIDSRGDFSEDMVGEILWRLGIVESKIATQYSLEGSSDEWTQELRQLLFQIYLAWANEI